MQLCIWLCSKDFFGESWNKVLGEQRAVNAMQACEKFGCSPAELDAAWKRSESASKVSMPGNLKTFLHFAWIILN